MASNKNHMLNDEFPKRIKNATSTSDGLMSAEDKSRIDELFEFGLLSPATPHSDGILTKEDKAKIDSVEEGANNYIHPNNETTRHVTDEQISTWNSKADSILVSNTENGLMSFEDKIKLDSIDSNATNYEHPESHPATMITQDDTHKFVTNEQISTWNAKASNSVATQTSNGLMSKEDKKKLDNIQSNATNYTHPESHPATMITQDITHRFVTDEQISTWNNLIDRIAAVEEKLKTAIYYSEN